MEGAENIIRLHHDFKKFKLYKDKVEFYDQHFGCFLHSYPLFDPDLTYLFNQHHFDLISSIFENERRKAIILKKSFIINGKTLIFNATPVNSNTSLFNDYVLYKFINYDTGFKQSMTEIYQVAKEKPGLILEKWLKALNRIESIENKLITGEERGLRYRFMNVFINGYIDQRNGLLKKFHSKKKFIELYLYAQGALYRQYFQLLHDLCDFSNTQTINIDENTSHSTSEIQLLKDYILNKYDRKENWSDSNVVTILTALLQLETNK